MIQGLLNSEVQEFIRIHENDDSATLMLQSKEFKGVPMREIVEQIQSRKKCKYKVPTWYSAKGIMFPPPLSLEQCSSEATARYKQQLTKGNKMADLTGGMGIDTYFLSHSFKECHYVERQLNLVNLAKSNFSILPNANVQVHNIDAQDFLEECDSDFDLMYIDPARRDENQRKVFQLSDCEPDLSQLLTPILSKTKSVLIKASPFLDIKGALRELGGASEIHVLALRGEVKELLFLIDKLSISQDPVIHCVDLQKGDCAMFKFRFSEEQDLETGPFGVPLKYLYEPNATVLKGGAFKSVADTYDLVKLHPNTHLYTSADLRPDFPGRIFKVLESISLSKKALKRHLPELQANITVRNYPMSVDQIRKKSGLKEGGDNYVFGFRDVESPKLILTEKIK